MRCHILLVVLVASCRSATSQELQVPVVGPVADRARVILERDSQRFIDFRRDLHRYPEVSGNEVRTAKVVADELRRLGLTVRTGIGGHGVIGVVTGRLPGPLVAYRADMDAVPSAAPDPVEFRSVNAGIRHICGHDVHTTIGVALATIFQSMRDSLAGSVMFVFQPAEERATGANAMLADGVFGAGAPVAIYGVHTSPYEAGVLATVAGPMMGGRDRLDVTMSGAGDLTPATSSILQALQQLSTVSPSDNFSNQPFDFIAVALSPVQSSAGRVIIQGNVSVASAASRERVRRLVTSGLQSLVPTGVTVAGTYQAKQIAGVTNDTVVTARAAAAVRRVLGDGALRQVTGIVPAFSEDFGSFQERVPGAFFFLGVSNGVRGWNGLPHSPDYVADERSITIGARAMAAVLLDRIVGDIR